MTKDTPAAPGTPPRAPRTFANTIDILKPFCHYRAVRRESVEVRGGIRPRSSRIKRAAPASRLSSNMLKFAERWPSSVRQWLAKPYRYPSLRRFNSCSLRQFVDALAEWSKAGASQSAYGESKGLWNGQPHHERRAGERATPLGVAVAPISSWVRIPHASNPSLEVDSFEH